MSCCAPEPRWRSTSKARRMPAFGRGACAGKPSARQRPQADRPVGSGRSLRRLHPGDRDRARAGSTASNMRASTFRPGASRCAGATDRCRRSGRDVERPRLCFASVRGRRPKDETLAELIRAVAIAGFAAGNIMLLSVSVWSGAEGATRDLFHWVSALIAIPALVFAGRIFFRSAWSALSHGRMNMDVPIALGVSLAYAMSLYETITSWRSCLFRRRRLAAVLPADRAHARPCHARQRAHGGARPGEAWRRAAPSCLRRRTARANTGRSARSNPACSSSSPPASAFRSTRASMRGRVRSRLLAGDRRKRAAAGRAGRRSLRAGTLNLTGAADDRGHGARRRIPSSPRCCG